MAEKKTDIARYIATIAKRCVGAAAVVAAAVACSHVNESYQTQHTFDSLLARADSFYYALEPDSALALLNDALNIATTPRDVNRAKIEIAWSMYFVGQTDSTKKLAQECLVYYDTADISTDTAQLHNKLTTLTLYADLLRNEDENKEAVRQYMRAANLAKQLGETKTYIASRMYVLEEEEATGNYISAIEGYQELLYYCDTPGHIGVKLNILCSLQDIFYSIGDVNEAQKIATQIKLTVDTTNLIEDAMLHSALMRGSLNSNNKQEQQQHADRLKQLISHHDIEKYTDMFDINCLLAEYYMRNKDYDSAQIFINKLIEEDYTLQNHVEETLMMRTKLALEYRNYPDAARLLRQLDPEELRVKDVRLFDRYLALQAEYNYYIGNYEQSYKYLNRKAQLTYTLKKDSISHNIAYKTRLYSRDTTIIAQDVRIKIQQNKIENILFWQTIGLIAAAILVVMLIIVSIVLSTSKIKKHAREIKRLNQQLKIEVHSRTSILREQENELKQKNNELTREIKYASRIQNAILPSPNMLKSCKIIEDSFILYKPCQTISGDFYWINRIEHKLFICCGDATGHGIPGAFVAMVCSTFLSDIASAGKNLTTLDIIEELDTSLRDILHNTSAQNNDSVDLSLLCIDTQTGTLTMSLARHNAFILKGEEMIVINGTKRSVGEIEPKVLERKFEETTIDIKGRFNLYMTTDGYESQLGGPDNKKLKRRDLKQTVMQIADLSMTDQCKILMEHVSLWRGKNDQTDDILVIGMTINTGNITPTATPDAPNDER